MYPNHRGLERRWAAVALGLLLLPTAARAHDADVVFATLTEDGDGLTEVLTLTAGTLSQLAPVDADGDGALTQTDLDARAAAVVAGVWEQIPLTPCTRSREKAVVREGFVELSARFVCEPGELAQDFKILRVLPTNYKVVAGTAIAQGNVQRLVLRAVPAVKAGLGFEAGLAAVAVWFEATLLLMLAFLMSGTVSAAVNRFGVLVLGHAAVSLALGLAGVTVPLAAGVGVMLAGGAAYALGVLIRGAERAPLLTLAVAAAGDAMRGDEGRALSFQLGRAAAYAAVALVLVPVARMVGRRPVWKRRAVITIACAALAALGFSLVQSLHGF